MENLFKTLSNYFLSKCRKVISLPEEIDDLSVPQRVWLVISIPIFVSTPLAGLGFFITILIFLSVGEAGAAELFWGVFFLVLSPFVAVLGPVLLYKLIDMLNNLVKFVLKKESSNLTSNPSEKEK